MIYFIGIVLILFVLFIVAGKGQADKQKERQRELEAEEERKQIEIADLMAKINSAFESGEITEKHRNIINTKLALKTYSTEAIEALIENAKNVKKYHGALIEKYGAEVGNRMVNQEYWIGMTAVQVRECKGEPDKIEKEVLKTKTKETYIYGNKSSGDYFVIENGLVVKFVDR